MNNMRSMILIFITIIFTVIGQVFTKKGAMQIGSLPLNKADIPIFLLRTLFKPYIFLGLLCAVVAALAWIGSLSKMKLSYAYPFLSVSYVLIMILSLLIFKEKIQLIQWAGILVICFGVFLISRV